MIEAFQLGLKIGIGFVGVVCGIVVFVGPFIGLAAGLASLMEARKK